MILRGDFLSDTLRMSTNIQVFIPDLVKEHDPYRVVYLLHGLHGNQGTWLDNTMLPVFARNYNAVFVMPEVGRSFYANQEYGYRYFTFVSEEIPSICRSVFNISAKREDTAVIGCSMGGYGALKLALTRPEDYGFCGAISPACLYFKGMMAGLRKDPSPFLKTGPEAAAILQDLRIVYGDGLMEKDENDIILLMKHFPPEAPKPKIYAACGAEDDLRKDNLRFKEDTAGAGFDYTYEEWPGGHDWYFFSEALKKALQVWYTGKPAREPGITKG
jgi:S-formylglutathione hydrolase FrmB